MENVVYSGGATGSDIFWGAIAKHVGHTVVHYSFNGHKCLAMPEDTIILNQQQLNIADPFLIQANIIMKRKFPTKTLHTNNLLRRNYWQVKESTSIYGVGVFLNNQIKGGTGWAFAMYINMKKNDNIYFLNQDDSSWYQYINSSWIKIETPAKPIGKWAGVGTRDLWESSHQKMIDIFEQ